MSTPLEPNNVQTAKEISIADTAYHIEVPLSVTKDSNPTREGGTTTVRIRFNDKENSVDLTTMEDIYIKFPFLKESDLQPEEARLHAELVLVLSGLKHYEIITSKPTQAEIKQWEKNYDAAWAATIKHFYDGPQPVNNSGNIDMSQRSMVPDYSVVSPPTQQNNLLDFYIVSVDDAHPRPIHARYSIGSSIRIEHL